MLVNFSIQNFGPIKEKQTISFEADRSSHLEDYYVIQAGSKLRLLKLILLYGANASGKSTVLKALDFLRTLVLQPADKKTELLDFQPFLFDKTTPLQTSFFSIDFIRNATRYRYDIEFNRTAIIKEELSYVLRNKNIFSRTTDTEKQITEITLGGSVKQNKKLKATLEANTLWNNTVPGGYLKTNIEFPELKEVTDWFRLYLKTIIDPGTDLQHFVTGHIKDAIISKPEVLNILSKADLNVSDIIIRKQSTSTENKLIELLNKTTDFSEREITELSKITIDKPEPEFQHTVNNEIYTLPFKHESEGTKRFYGFAGLLALMKNSPGCFAVDELETSLHPDLLTHFLLSFLVNVKSSQMIATTHYREIMSNKDILRNDALWFTDKSESSATSVYSLAHFESSVVRDTTNILNAYKAGKLGGVPNTGDYFLE